MQVNGRLDCFFQMWNLNRLKWNLQFGMLFDPPGTAICEEITIMLQIPRLEINPNRHPATGHIVRHGLFAANTQETGYKFHLFGFLITPRNDSDGIDRTRIQSGHL